MTARVDFHGLQGRWLEQPVRYVCALSHKAWKSGLRVQILCAQTALLDEIDSALWTFRPDSFLAHDRSGRAPIHLGGQPVAGYDFTIQLFGDTCLPASLSPRLAEIFRNRPGEVERARQRYRTYRQAGCTLNYHEVGQA